MQVANMQSIIQRFDSVMKESGKEEALQAVYNLGKESSWLSDCNSTGVSAEDILRECRSIVLTVITTMEVYNYNDLIPALRKVMRELDNILE